MYDEPVPVRLARIEEKIDSLIGSKKDHETRLRTVERRSWIIAGAAMVVSFFAPGLKFGA